MSLPKSVPTRCRASHVKAHTALRQPRRMRRVLTVRSCGIAGCPRTVASVPRGFRGNEAPYTADGPSGTRISISSTHMSARDKSIPHSASTAGDAYNNPESDAAQLRPPCHYRSRRPSDHRDEVAPRRRGQPFRPWPGSELPSTQPIRPRPQLHHSFRCLPTHTTHWLRVGASSICDGTTGGYAVLFRTGDPLALKPTPAWWTCGLAGVRPDGASPRAA